MDNNKNLREKLNTPPADLPEELDWANMKEGIFSKMEGASKGTQGAPQKRNQIYILIATVVVLVLLMIRMCGYSSWYTQDTEGGSPSAFAVGNESPDYTYDIAVAQKAGEQPFEGQSEGSLVPNTSSLTSKSSEAPSNSSTPSGRTGAKGNDRSSGLELASASAAQESAPESGRASNRALHTKPENEPTETSAQDLGRASGGSSVLGSGSDSGKEYTSTALAKNLATPAEVTPAREADGAIQTRRADSSSFQLTLEALGALDLIPLGLLGDQAVTQLVAPASTFTPPSPDSYTKHSLVLSSGISVWDPGYSNTVPERANFERAQVSFSHHVSYAYRMNNNFYLTTGLQMHLLESRFDWSAPISDYKITLEDVVVERVTDALRGDVEIVRGDVEVPVDAERVVRHYNRTTLFQLPLGLGTIRSVGPVDLSFELGSSINIVGNSRGRTLDEGSIIELDASGKDLFDSQWGIHGFAGLRVHYLIGDNWSVNLGAQYQKALTNWSAEENTGMRPQIMTMEVGLGYRFD